MDSEMVFSETVGTEPAEGEPVESTPAEYKADLIPDEVEVTADPELVEEPADVEVESESEVEVVPETKFDKHGAVVQFPDSPYGASQVVEPE